MGGGLTILFTNIWLQQYSGSEVVTRDLAVGSLRRGHRPIIYTPAIGPVAHELIDKGIAVVDDLRLVAEPPDVIHAHHVIPCAEAIIRFPEVPVVNVCHAFAHWLEAPAHFPQVGAYVAVDEACRDRLVHTEGIDPARVVVLPNAVDMSRIPPRARSLAERPRRAVAFGKATLVAQIRAACEALSIEFATIGPHAGREVAHPERELVGFDLVFASARAALEGLCCGCAVIVCDERGSAGLVTPDNFAALRANNFGLRSLTTPVSTEGLIEQVRRYDPDDARRVCERARREADLEKVLDAFDLLYGQVMSGARASPVRRDAHEAAVARFLHAYLPRRPNDPRWPWLAERQVLDGRIAELESRLADAARELEQRSVAGRAAAELERARTDLRAAELEQARTDLRAAEQRLAIIKRSRLLKLGRWLRRFRGLPLPY
jgi:hypothetical protein